MGAQVTLPCCIPSEHSTNLVRIGSVPPIHDDRQLLSSKTPIIIFQQFQQEEFVEGNIFDQSILTRIQSLLAFVVPLGPTVVRLIELRSGSRPSILHDLLPPSCHAGTIEVATKARDIAASIGEGRILLCAGDLEMALYTVHEINLLAGMREVGLVPQLCSSCDRSGSIPRPNLISHLEEVLNVTVLNGVKAAIEWMFPNGPMMSTQLLDLAQNLDLKIEYTTKTSAVLDSEQEHVVKLMVGPEVVKLKLKQIGKGWSKALKYFCVPVMNLHGHGSDETDGSMTFLKIGPEEEVQEELETTRKVMALIGNFCPQVLGYAEVGETGGLLLTLASMGEGAPMGFTDLYAELLQKAGHDPDTAAVVYSRLESCIHNVFGYLVAPMHASATWSNAFSVVDALGLCFDLNGGCSGVEPSCPMASGWVLEKVWRKWGTGKLASSINARIVEVLGEEKASRPTLKFLLASGTQLELPNIKSMLEDKQVMTALRQRTTKRYKLCLVHGDLHGDNIMVDSKDNRFLIDFGKTRRGHELEDVTWLESFCLLSYTDIDNEHEFLDALALVPSLASAFSAETCKSEALNKAVGATLQTPRMHAMWSVVQCIREQLGHSLKRMPESEAEDAAMIAKILFMRNALFFFSAPQSGGCLHRRKFALALACAYGQSLLDGTEAFK